MTKHRNLQGGGRGNGARGDRGAARAGGVEQPALFELEPDRARATTFPAELRAPDANVVQFGAASGAGIVPGPAASDGADGWAIGDEPAEPSVVAVDRLPGKLSYDYLRRHGVLTPLDGHSAYVADDGATLFGRAAIVADVIGTRTLRACGRTAAWVWNGGEFPDDLDLWSNSRFHGSIHGRRVHCTERRIPDGQFVAIGRLVLTSPARTVCDLALLPLDGAEAASVGPVLSALMRRFDVAVDECLAMLHANPNVRQAEHARSLIGLADEARRADFAEGA
ncbi:hypothetical protein [Bifidobacterium choloepi]|uniref:Uncharacterized protein n=1 Tax=Bifidobacterium choloepi TaxID=2614131 RepID=A0A6I5NGZ1_9BIFI|nr:hypothetical protein [Bifidobacterium choloepi]NEG70514.1 hypothetical protein [Bifidobacterium choloepi]